MARRQRPRGQFRTATETWYCACNPRKPAKTGVSNTDRNKGRSFLNCFKCNFFLWEEDATKTEREAMGLPPLADSSSPSSSTRAKTLSHRKSQPETPSPPSSSGCKRAYSGEEEESKTKKVKRARPAESMPQRFDGQWRFPDGTAHGGKLVTEVGQNYLLTIQGMRKNETLKDRWDGFEEACERAGLKRDMTRGNHVEEPILIEEQSVTSSSSRDSSRVRDGSMPSLVDVKGKGKAKAIAPEVDTSALRTPSKLQAVKAWAGHAKLRRLGAALAGDVRDSAHITRVKSDLVLDTLERYEAALKANKVRLNPNTNLAIECAMSSVVELIFQSTCIDTSIFHDDNTSGLRDSWWPNRD